MLNSITIMGRLTRDPELRRTGTGIACTSASIAVDRDFGGKDKPKETDFFDVVAWRSTAEFFAKYFEKGKMVVISGKLQSRSWTDKDGNKRRAVEIVANENGIYFADSRKNDEVMGPAPAAPAPHSDYGVLDDEDGAQLPF